MSRGGPDYPTRRENYTLKREKGRRRAARPYTLRFLFYPAIRLLLRDRSILFLVASVRGEFYFCPFSQPFLYRASLLLGPQLRYLLREHVAIFIIKQKVRTGGFFY